MLRNMHIQSANKDKLVRSTAEERSMFEKPSLPELRNAAQQLGMNPSDDYLRAIDEITAPIARAYAALDAMPDELPPVKYPRGPQGDRSGDKLFQP